MKRGPRGYEEVRRQVLRRILDVASEVAVSTGALYSELSALVAEYACHGWFSAQAGDGDFLSVAGGHWWSVEGERRLVCSSHFEGSVGFPAKTATARPALFLAELPDGCLLIASMWLTPASRQVVECARIAKDGSSTELSQWQFDQRSEWWKQVCLVQSGSSEAGPGLELVVPTHTDRVVVLDLTGGGGALRTVRMPFLRTRRYQLFQGDRDLLFFVDEWYRTRVYSWRAQRVVADWKNSCIGWAILTSLVRGQTVNIIDTYLLCRVTHDFSTGRELARVHLRSADDHAGFSAAPLKPRPVLALDWLTVRQHKGILFAVL